MRFECVPNLTNARRRVRDSGTVLRKSHKTNLLYTMSKPGNPNTPDQAASRESMRAAGAAWKALSEAQRERYHAFAHEYAERIGVEHYKQLCGWDVFFPSFRNRTLLGLPPVAAPLDCAPPRAPLSVEEAPADSASTFAFRVTHRLPVGGHMLLVRITPAMPRESWRPRAHNARMIRGYGPRSLVPLPETGGVVVFDKARFAIEPGQRYGVEMRIVRVDDGVHGMPLFVDLVRKDLVGEAPVSRPADIAVAEPRTAAQPRGATLDCASEKAAACRGELAPDVWPVARGDRIENGSGWLIFHATLQSRWGYCCANADLSLAEVTTAKQTAKRPVGHAGRTDPRQTVKLQSIPPGCSSNALGYTQWFALRSPYRDELCRKLKPKRHEVHPATEYSNSYSVLKNRHSRSRSHRHPGGSPPPAADCRRTCA